MIAETLYYIFAQVFGKFEKNLAPAIFKKFINYPWIFIYDGDKFATKNQKKANTPIL